MSIHIYDNGRIRLTGKDANSFFQAIKKQEEKNKGKKKDDGKKEDNSKEDK